MKLKIILLGVFIGILSIQCKKDVKTDTVEVEDKNLFVITLNATVLKNDNFQIYYRQSNTDNYDDTKSLFVEVKGNTAPQDIVFTLPEDVIPEFIRLDFGINKEQSPIKVNNFQLKYLDKQFSVDGINFFNYMQAAPLTMKVDKATGVATPLLVDGSYDPITTSELGLQQEIHKLLK